MPEKDKQQLLRLIDKLNDGSISNEEVKQLSNFFIGHQNIKIWPLEDELKQQIKDNLFEKIQLEISKRDTPVVPLYKKSLFKYAIVASIAILISLPFVFSKKEPVKNIPKIVNNTIEIGTDKAILTLEDNTNIELVNGQNYTSDNLLSNGKELIYTNTNIKKDIAYNYLTIPRGGQYVVQLSDGTKIWLNSESKLKYPVNFTAGKTRQVELIYGEAYFDVSPSVNHNNALFKVSTYNQEVEVLGTEFNISAYQDEDAIYTTLVEGKVAVSNNSNTTILSPEQQSIIIQNSEDINIVNVDTYIVTSWRNGIFSFDKMPLEKIMKVLARWYDIDVIFINTNVQQDYFTGTLRKNQNIEEILESIRTTNNMAYEINNNTIIIR